MLLPSMVSRRIRTVVVGSAALLALVHADAAAQSAGAGTAPAAKLPRFELTLLQVPDGTESGTATALSERGEIAGTVLPQGTGSELVVHAAYWSDGGAQPVLATGPGAGFAEVHDIDGSGLVVGHGHTSSAAGQTIPFLWVAGQDLEPVPDAGGIECLSATGINERGVLVGVAGFPQGVAPAQWIQGVPQALPLPPGDDLGGAYAISDAGHVVGYSAGPLTGYLATRWFAGAVERLQFPGALHSTAVDVNDRGEAVGDVIGAGPPTVAVVWRGLNGVALPALGGSQSWARALNDHSWIVGAAQLPAPSGSDAVMHAALWIGQQVHDLNALTVALPAGVVLVSAEDVNDAGQIVGWADVGGTVRPFLLEPAGG